MNAGKNADRNAGKNAGKNAGSFSLVCLLGCLLLMHLVSCILPRLVRRVSDRDHTIAQSRAEIPANRSIADHIDGLVIPP